MKLRDIAKGTRAVKTVEIRLMNTRTTLPGLSPSEDPSTFKLGVRVLTGAETIEVYEKAEEYVRTKGVIAWQKDHPICAMAGMAFALAIACVEVDAKTGLPDNPNKLEPLFEDANEILNSDLLGPDNIVFIHEHWFSWNEELSDRFQKLSHAQAVGVVLADLQRKSDDPGPLVQLPHATLVSLVRFLTSQLQSLPTAKSVSGQLSDSSSTTNAKTVEPSSSTISSEGADR